MGRGEATHFIHGNSAIITISSIIIFYILVYKPSFAANTNIIIIDEPCYKYDCNCVLLLPTPTLITIASQPLAV